MSRRNPIPESMEGASKVSILHHWDADGIASASLIMNWARERGFDYENSCPEIGDYSGIAGEVIDLASGDTDAVIGLDLALSAKSVEMIERKNTTPIIWFDHHSNPPPTTAIEYFHPSSSLAEPVPSNSWFMEKVLGNRVDLLGAIGAYGDLGRNLLESPFYCDFSRICGENNISVENMIEIVDLIDSNYRSDDRGGVISCPHILSDSLASPRDLLGNEGWNRNKEIVDIEISRILAKKPKRMGDVMLREINSKMHLTSEITRISASRATRERAVVVYNRNGDMIPFYVRRIRKGVDLTPLIEIGRKMGFSSGGKPEVVGMVIPQNDLDKIVDRTMEFLEADT